MKFAQKNFPGHQTLVCTHPDGHNSAGNIHVHIVINSVRAFDVTRQDFMERPADSLAGHKHHVTKDFLEYLKSETMLMCQKEAFYQVDLLNPAKIRITDREYWHSVADRQSWMLNQRSLPLRISRRRNMKLRKDFFEESSPIPCWIPSL